MKQTSFQEKIVSLSRTVILSSITIFALYSVSAWAGPASTPPIGNVSGPITTGNSLLGPNSPMQTRYGSLVVSGNLGLTGSLILSNGAGTGKVLTSDASGIASWQNPNGGVKSDVSIYKCPVFESPYIGSSFCYVISGCGSECIGQYTFNKNTCRYVSGMNAAAALAGEDATLWDTKNCPSVGNVMVQ